MIIKRTINIYWVLKLCSCCFTYIILLNPHKNLEAVTVKYSFYGWGHRDLEVAFLAPQIWTLALWCLFLTLPSKVSLVKHLHCGLWFSLWLLPEPSYYSLFSLYPNSVHFWRPGHTSSVKRLAPRPIQISSSSGFWFYFQLR